MWSTERFIMCIKYILKHGINHITIKYWIIWNNSALDIFVFCTFMKWKSENKSILAFKTRFVFPSSCLWKIVSSVDLWSGMFSYLQMKWTLSYCKTLHEKKQCNRSSDWSAGWGVIQGWVMGRDVCDTWWVLLVCLKMINTVCAALIKQCWSVDCTFCFVFYRRFNCIPDISNRLFTKKWLLEIFISSQAA